MKITIKEAEEMTTNFNRVKKTGKGKEMSRKIKNNFRTERNNKIYFQNQNWGV